MIILIDAYNVAKGFFVEKKINAKNIQQFVALIENYLEKKKFQGILVFDGMRVDNEVDAKPHSKNISIIYSGEKSLKNADILIKSLCKQLKNYHIILITSDNELKKFANSLKIVTIASPYFIEKILQSSENEIILNHGKKHLDYSRAQKRIDSDSNDFVDQLMEKASLTMMIKSEDMVPIYPIKKIKSEKKLSKNEKKLKKVTERL